ncbi:hypothetical protein EOA13_36535 [Mesorhizobium sp. M7A.F.Ca.US.011.01.1.1]|uniref:hypothetical protein n=1 Tax=Mesorhizobium sp. M7A.F.Ca.US.011.01.1.1 TaxID=2496741 RepID=UPI000FCC946A|nr:hypothetical protein [Mesorhizobium sp. M7A.F.Ca.US.011.01.1.1]RUX21985.1 hypothetical protein EOA13_36535 [Mesorhizobium sp. M7A.F.Ca.US.011.01.1.1]
MTLRYVRSGAGGAANGTDWANAYLTIAAALTASAAGDTIYVSEDHAASLGATQTYTSPGTAAAPVRVVCVNHSGSVPPVSADIRTTAAESTTTSNAMTFAGDFVVYDGIIFTCGSGSSSAIMTVLGVADKIIKIRNGALRLGTSSSTASIALGNNSAGGASIEMENTTVQFGHVSQKITCAAEVLWKDTPSAVTGATIPTALFAVAATNRGAHIECRGVDLSALGSGKTIFSNTAAQIAAQLVLNDCKIDTAVTLCSRPGSRGEGGLDYFRVDSGGTNYKHGRIRFEGTQTEETTIVRSGGASDNTTPIAEKIVTTANCSEHFPFKSLPIAIWNDTTGASVTATIEGIWGGGAVPNNNDIWLEVEYLGSASSPQASFVNDTKADPLAANAGHTSSSETWGGSTTKFKMAVSFTPQQKGLVMARVIAAAASSTFYVCPKVALS